MPRCRKRGRTRTAGAILAALCASALQREAVAASKSSERSAPPENGSDPDAAAANETSEPQQVWHLVDVPAVVCSGAPGSASVALLPGGNASQSDVPHVLTFFRTSRRNITVNFTLTSSNGTVILPPTTVDLRALAVGDTSPPRLLSGRGGAPKRFHDGSEGARRSVLDQAARAAAAFGAAARRLLLGNADVAPVEKQPAHIFAAGALQASEEPLNPDCEEFFLLDGRSPVELPETFGEARIGFRQICESEMPAAAACDVLESQVFDACSAEPDSLLGGAEAAIVCRNLLAAFGERLQSPEGRRLATPPRRAKGIGGSTHGGYGGGGRGYSGGGYSHGGSHGGTRTATYANSAGAPRAVFTSAVGSRHIGAYGYTQRYIGSAYPLGFRDTAYGYSGLAPYSPGMHVALMFGTGMATGYAFSRFHTYCRYSSCRQPSASDSSAECPEGGQCPRQALLSEPVVRDDLMFTGFLPKDHEAPFILTVTQIEGVDYSAERVCPPPNWNGGIVAGKGSGWRPPLQQDLFATLTPVVRPAASYDEVPMWAIGLLIGLFFCTGLLCTVHGVGLQNCVESCRCRCRRYERGGRSGREAVKSRRICEHDMKQRRLTIKESSFCGQCDCVSTHGDWISECKLCRTVICSECARHLALQGEKDGEHMCIEKHVEDEEGFPKPTAMGKAKFVE